MAQPNDKLVVGARVIYKTETKGSADVDLSFKGSGRSKEVHYSSTPTTARIRIRLVTAAATKDGELCLFDAEEAFLETSVGVEIYI